MITIISYVQQFPSVLRILSRWNFLRSYIVLCLFWMLKATIAEKYTDINTDKNTDTNTNTQSHSENPLNLLFSVVPFCPECYLLVLA